MIPPDSSQDPAPDFYARAKALLLDAMDLPAGERRAWIEERTGAEPALRAEALELLRRMSDLGDFLEVGVRAPTGVSLDELEVPASVLPQSVGGMRIRRALGFGGMGVVYLAEQTEPTREVAVKVMHQRSKDPGAAVRFRREVEILGRLRHPGIVQVFDAGMTGEGSHWFSMEYVEGETLSRSLVLQEQSPEAIAEFVVRIADIVAYAHANGVLHRDLKPDNILIEPDGTPRLLDFGVARLIGDDNLPSLHTLTGAVIGTVAYMSPEQARGVTVDERSDVFSLGAILYELLSSNLPFDARGRSLQQLVQSVTQEEPVPLSRHRAELRGDLEVVVHTAIATDPRMRYGSIESFAADLRRWIDRRPIEARPPTVIDQVSKFVRRNRRLTAAAAGIFAVLAMALAFSLDSLHQAQVAGRRSLDALADVVGFSRGYAIDEMLTRSDELWPAGPQTLHDLRDLLEDARGVLQDLPAARAHLTDLRRLQAEGMLAARYGGGLDGRWIVLQQEVLLERIESLESGLITDVEQRIAAAELATRSLEEQKDRWREVALAVRESDTYAGLELAPQAGLIPLGPDPESGLEEFAALVPGCTVPSRSSGSQFLEVGADTTVILVLLPGGRVTIGAQADDPEGTHYDRFAGEFRWPVTERELDPFFVSKYEVTQYQWETFTGHNPSYWRAGKLDGLNLINLRHPVDSVPWNQALEFCRKLGMTFPTEVQFEYAARGGASGPTWWGDGEIHDRDHVNFFRLEQGKLDSYRIHSPVGRFPTNPYGLHDALGNVSEMCLDEYKLRPAIEPFEPGTARVLADGGGEHSVRGGSYDSRSDGTFSWRGDIKHDGLARNVGFRPIRYLDPLAASPAPSR